MRQVPQNQADRRVPRYALLGAGRLARHLQHYFSALQISFKLWSRADGDSGLGALADCDVFLLAVSDGSIDELATRVQEQVPHAKCVHFSGAVVSRNAVGWHPLMTFSQALYPVEFYRQIPFVGEMGSAPFQDLFPLLPNPHPQIVANDRGLYHALCVLSGNFTQLLWMKAVAEMSERFQIDKALLKPFFQAGLENFFASRGEQALTGPLVRRDYTTLKKNLLALADDPYLGVYQAFLKTYGETHENFELRKI